MAVIQDMMAAVDGMAAALVAGRRDLHRYPEPGWTEFRTAAKVAKTLHDLGYEVAMGKEAVAEAAMMGRPSAADLKAAQARAIEEGADPALVAAMAGGLTGVVGTLRFQKPGPVVGLRFDMDSNDVQETDDPKHFPNREGFASVHDNAMHACGHDGHTTVGLALAKLFKQFEGELCGTVKLVFQPAEEGVRGAKAMVECGVVDDVDFMLGAHFGFKMRKTGSIACNVTGFLATSKYDARFTGVPAHAGAAPEEGKNALLAAACAALNLHAIARHGAGSSRINVGRIEAGSGRNIIGDRALLQLETRGATSEINAYMENEAVRIIEAAARMYDVEVTVEKVGGAAGGSNSPALAAYLEAQADKLGIFSRVVGDCDFGASEDFSYFMERVQARGGEAAYMMVGADLAAGHHDARFTFDEAALPYAVKIMATATVGLLRGEKG
ncbi:MAG: amidohydrolase [Schwartzia sp. (in: firmicutes)]